MNPCPCGYYGDVFRACTCTPGNVQKYQKRISGPLLDRIDLHVEVPRLTEEELLHAPTAGDLRHHPEAGLRGARMSCRLDVSRRLAARLPDPAERSGAHPILRIRLA